MVAVRIDNVRYDYSHGDSRVEALKGVSLEIESGEFVALAGRNGSGKSTLAKLMNGLMLPTEGSVEAFGVSTADEDRIFEVRRNVGMVFQNPDNQMIATVVEDEIAFGPENVGVPREEIEQRIDWALACVGMSGHRKSTPHKMSGGQKQRIAIAGVLALKPKVLLLDESTAMLDPAGRREIMNVLKALHRDGITVVLITHFMEEAAEADRIVVLHDGTIAMQGTPEEIFRRREELERYKLRLPPVQAIADMLRERNVDVGEISSEEELVDRICRLL